MYVNFYKVNPPRKAGLRLFGGIRTDVVCELYICHFFVKAFDVWLAWWGAFAGDYGEDC